jgi:hypothetical protein
MVTKTKDVGAIFTRYEQLKTKRHQYNSIYDEITEFLLTHRGDFAEKRSDGQRKLARYFDSTGPRALEHLVATLSDGIMPTHEKWGVINVANPEIVNIHELQVNFEQRNNILYDFLNAPQNNFHSQKHEFFFDVAGYGTGCMYVDDDQQEGLLIKAVHLSEILIAEDKKGMVDTVFRTFTFTVRQAAQQWGLENVSEDTRKALAENPDKEIEILHYVTANDGYSGQTKVATKLPFISYYCEVANMHVLQEGGYHEFPYMVSRWFKFVGETEGRSPAWSAMPDIRSANVLMRDLLVAAQRGVLPTYLLPDDGVALPLDTRPGGTIFGATDRNSGRPLVTTLPDNSKISEVVNLYSMVQQTIRNAFYVDPLAFRETNRATALEIRERVDEGLRLIGPQVGRTQTEFAGPLLRRVYGILERAGAFPPLPPDLEELVNRVGLDITYSAPLFNTQRRQEIQALSRTFEVMLPMGQVDPTVYDVFNLDSSARGVAERLGVPKSFMTSEDEAAAKKAERAEQQQAMMEQQMAIEGQKS